MRATFAKKINENYHWTDRQIDRPTVRQTDSSKVTCPSFFKDRPKRHLYRPFSCWCVTLSDILTTKNSCILQNNFIIISQDRDLSLIYLRSYHYFYHIKRFHSECPLMLQQYRTYGS